MNEWQKQRNERIEEVLRTCSHPAIDRIIGKPVIHSFRVSALMLAFSEEERQTKAAQKKITAALLIQLGMDTHDLIAPAIKEISPKEQLLVLAGDYFSGMYYRTLAEIGSIKWVDLLSEAVKTLNEAKTALHENQAASAEEVLKTAETAETAIIRAVFKENEVAPLLTDTVCQLLLADRLLREKQQPFSLYESLRFLEKSEKHAMRKMADAAEALQQSVYANIEQLDAKSAPIIQAEANRLFNGALRLIEER